MMKVVPNTGSVDYKSVFR